MRVISIFTVDASKAGPPTQEAMCQMNDLIKEYSANGVLDVKDRTHLLEVTQRFLECAGGGTCTIHQLAQMDEPACAQ